MPRTSGPIWLICPDDWVQFPVCSWGAPRIHGELRMLDFELSERTISRWMKKAPRDPDHAKRWLAFLRNHREAIAAMDFFTVPVNLTAHYDKHCAAA